jgi:long-chain fatty acid transport protein
VVWLGAAIGAAPAQADGGYYAGALGARASGRAGAFAARADDLTAAYYNPAGLAKLDGTIIQIGNRFSHNDYSYTRAPTLDWGHTDSGGQPPTVTFAPANNGAPWQPVEPLLGVASNLGLRGWGFALSAFAPPGVSRFEVPLDGGQRYMMLKREAIIVNYAASIAWRLRDLFGIGVSLEWISVPRLVYSLVIDGTPFAGAGNPVSSDLDIQATTTGSDPFVFNAIVGGWFRPAPYLEIGVSGQVVPSEIATHSRLTATPLTSSLGSLTLTRKGVPADDVSVRLPMPLLARAGARYRHLTAGRETFDIELDVEYETWSRVNRFSVETNGLDANLEGQAVPLGRIDIQKHWRDTLSVKLGGDVALVPDRWTLRGGVFYETAVADPAYANVDFSGGPQAGAAAGASMLFGRLEIAAAYQLRVQTAVSVAEGDARVYQQVPGSACQSPYNDTSTCNPHYLNQPSPTVNAGRYSATSHFVSFGVIYRY